MRAHYGYADGSGEYFLTVDTDRCDGCSECVKVCPRGLLEVVLDDYDEPKACVREDVRRRLGQLCPGHAVCVAHEGQNCHGVCRPAAIEHSW